MEGLTAFFSGIGLQGFALNRLLPALCTLLVCLAALWVVMRIVKRSLAKTPLDRTLQTFIRTGIRVFLWLIVALIVADALDIPVTSLIAVLSVAGLAVSLAVQGALSNLAGGLVILASRPFTAGDFIEVGPLSGTVFETGLLHTKLLSIDNKLILVPNADLSAQRIINYTAEKTRRVDLSFTVSGQNSARLVREALTQSMEGQALLLPDPAPFIGVSACEGGNVTYVLQVWVNTPDYLTVRYALTERVKTAFDEKKISMDYQQVRVHMADQ